MAASSFLLHFPSFCSFRKSQVCLHLPSAHWQKSITCFSVHLQKKRCKMKICMIPGKAMARNLGLKLFAAAGSLDTDVGTHESQVSSKVANPNDVHRYKTLLDCSSNSVDATSEFERQLQELFNEVKNMIAAGNKNEAIDLLQANYEAVQEQMNAGWKGKEEVAVLDIVALGYMAIGDLKFVGVLLDTMEEIVDSLKDEEPLMDAIMIHMGSMYSALEKFEKSLLLYQRVVTTLESRSGKNSNFLITPLLGMAKVLGSVGRATKAMEIYKRAIIILETNRGAESEDLVLPLFGLGNLLIKEGKALDAERAFSRILQIYTNIYGENDGRVGMAMCSLAQAKCARGNADEAIGLYENALQVIKDSNYMALDDSMMENMRVDLAELLHLVGRGKEGRELLEECLLITERYKGKEHPSSVPHLLNLATSYSHSKNFIEAEHILRKSLEIMTRNVEPEDPSISFPMLQLGVTLYHLNRDEEAEKLVLKVLHIREKAFGKESLPVGEALDCLVSIQTRLGKDESGLLELLQRVLSIQEKEFGNESEEVLETMKKVVFYLDKLGRKDEKFALQRRLSNLRMKYKEKVNY